MSIEARLDLVALVHEVRFTPVRLREGYEMSEVDDFCDQLETALTRGQPVGPLVEGAQFTAVRLREGYDMGDVDDFLEKIVREQSTPSPVAGASTNADTATYPVTSSPAGSVIEEQRSLFAKLFRRKS